MPQLPDVDEDVDVDVVTVVVVLVPPCVAVSAACALTKHGIASANAITSKILLLMVPSHF